MTGCEPVKLDSFMPSRFVVGQDEDGSELAQDRSQLASVRGKPVLHPLGCPVDGTQEATVVGLVVGRRCAFSATEPNGGIAFP